MENNEQLIKDMFSTGAMDFLTALHLGTQLPRSKVPHHVGKSQKAKDKRKKSRQDRKRNQGK